MRLREHLIIGGAGAVFLYFYPVTHLMSNGVNWGFWRVLLFFAATVLIDADHYWDYLWRSKFADWSGWRMFRYYDLIEERGNKKNFYAFSLLHTAEILGGVYLLAYYWSSAVFMPVFWGMVFHLFLDTIYFARRRHLFIRAYSIIEYWVRKPRLIRQGIDSDAFCREMFEKSKRPV
jgi:hypothetical protein